jgi:multisubunit Na+/H+ antiporter MnhG subunit
MEERVLKVFPRNITKSQAKDTGMAMVLVCLLLGFFLDNAVFTKIAVAALVIDMIYPMSYRFIAYAWLGLSNTLGMVVSKILLGIVFFIIVTPVGLVRKMLGMDSLKLRQFKKGSGSVMVIRNKSFTKEDIERPF